MKKIYIIIFITILISSCTNQNTEIKNNINSGEKITETKVNLNSQNEYVVDESDYINTTNLLKDIKLDNEINEDDKNGLIKMREEEKLAYDVYITLYKKWGKNIFQNISNSEKTHTDAVLSLLNTYSIEDPVKNNLVGVFKSDELQTLYISLIEKGNISLLDALEVGITIEDLDIFDLDNLIAKTKNQDIITVYENLNRGSRNHMRAFYKNILNEGGKYEAQYISQEKFQTIINGNQEKGGNH